jgi:transcriptional regulator with XRE-family HTH domain
MNTKIKEVRRGIEDWQLEDANRLRDIFDTRKAAAKRAGERFTQETLAEAAGISSPAMVWQYLKGHRALNIKAAGGLARALGVQVREFSPRLAEEIATVAPAVSGREEAPNSYSLSVEKLLLIHAINEREAAILRRYRMADAVGVEMIETAAANAPRRNLGSVINDESQSRAPGTGSGHSL